VPGEGRVKGSSAISGKEVTVTKTDVRLEEIDRPDFLTAGRSIEVLGY